MKILAISHEYPPLGGGGANACMFLLNGFAKRGHEVTLISAGYEGLDEDEYTSQGLHIIRVPAKRKHVEHCSFMEMLSFVVKSWPVAKKEVKTGQKNNHPYEKCLIFFGIPSGVIGYGLKKLYKIPYYIRFGGGDIPGFQDRFKKIYQMIAPAIKLIWKNAEKRIANSEGLRKMAYEFCSKYTFDVINNGVDLEVFHPNAEGREEANEKQIKLLFVSRLIERKGLQHVLPQLSQIDNVLLTIVGDGPYRENLEKLVIENHIEGKVLFVGQKDKSELVPFYQEADIFILPSEKEGMPNVVLEAMACGLPIIMTPCQGSDELVDGTNGIVAKRESFGTLIDNLIDNPNRIHEMSVCSRQKAVDYFSWDYTIEQYLKVLSAS